MNWAGWVAFAVSQVVVLVVGAWGLLALTDVRKPSRDAVRTTVFLAGICAVLLVVLDGFVMTGVMGPGWPLSVRTSMELLAAAVLLGLLVFTVIGIVDGKDWSTFGGFFGLLGVALFGLLLVTNGFNGHHSGADAPSESADSTRTTQPSHETSVPSSTPSGGSSPSAIVTALVTGAEGATQPTASQSAGDSPATWVAAGGALLGGLGAFLAVIRRRRDG